MIKNIIIIISLVVAYSYVTNQDFHDRYELMVSK